MSTQEWKGELQKFRSKDRIDEQLSWLAMFQAMSVIAFVVISAMIGMDLAWSIPQERSNFWEVVTLAALAVGAALACVWLMSKKSDLKFQLGQL